MLIIGSADTTYNVNQITRYTSKKVVNSLFGAESDLADAFNLAFDMGVKEIYLANALSKTAYVDIMKSARQFNLSYIVPLGVRFSDKAFNSLLNKQQSFSEIFLRTISIAADSIIVMTDNHASLYENIDHYLDDMLSEIRSFKEVSSAYLENGRQLWFVANQLQDVKYSNVLLTAMICTSNIPEYPTTGIPEAIFDIDSWDIGINELIYFKNNINDNNSIENFVNFHNENNAYKMAPIDLVIRKINEDLNFDHFSGKLFSQQVKLRMQAELQSYLESIRGKLIRDFTILSIDSYLESDYSYLIVINFSILPMNSLEYCNVIIEV